FLVLTLGVCNPSQRYLPILFDGISRGFLLVCQQLAVDLIDLIDILVRLLEIGDVRGANSSRRVGYRRVALRSILNRSQRGCLGPVMQFQGIPGREKRQGEGSG